ncbi:MAG: hypothetical protein EOM19_01020 [Candidatus Moranbacteria bacterium]|nr:hypothetical protein [Candidatus Moranbacteria bacterium]
MNFADIIKKQGDKFLHFFITKKFHFFFLSLFFIFGVGSFFLFENLAKFETSDEDYWKEDRIPSYWEGIRNGLREGDWSRTAINDKPGVGLALISGVGLPFVPEIGEYVRSGRVGGDWLYRSFKTEWSESINLGLRLPVAIFSLLMFLFLLFLIFQWTHSFRIVSLSALFLFLHPFLLGISRILNPDTIFWITSFISFVAFFLCLEKRQWRYVFLSSIFFGLAISSKYTANLLLPIFLMTLSIFFVFRFSFLPKKEAQKIFRLSLLQFTSIFILGYALFAFLMPAVFQKPSLFWSGTLFSPGLTPIIPFVGVFFISIVIDVFLLKSFFLFTVSSFSKKYTRFFLRFFASLLLILILAHIINGFLGAPFIPIDDIKEITRGELNGEKYNKTLPFPYAKNDTLPLAFSKKIMAQSVSTLFSIPSFIFFVLILGLIRILWRGTVPFQEYVFIALIVPWIFFVGGIISGVFVNARYAILIQPFIALLTVILLIDLLIALGKKYPTQKNSIFLGVFIIGFFSMTSSLLSIKPYYLNYQNIFLPRELSLADSWSYGIYEAAQYLNNKPLAEYLEVWSDRQAFCRYFVGKCLKSDSFDLSQVQPDYIVITRRNVTRGNHFSWKYPEGKRYDPSYYYTEAFKVPEWELLIGNRPGNYVKIIKLYKEIKNKEEREL